MLAFDHRFLSLQCAGLLRKMYSLFFMIFLNLVRIIDAEGTWAKKNVQIRLNYRNDFDLFL